jgi:hypothetical protein
MALKKPIVLGSNGLLEELQSTDYIYDASPNIISIIAGEALAINDVVYIKSSDSRAYKARADAEGTMSAIGVAIQAATAAGETISVQLTNVLSGFTGLTPAAVYFVSSVTAGAISTSIPSGVGSVVQSIGKALTATELLITPGTPIKRG